MTSASPDVPVHRFRPTSGTVAGWTGVVLAVLVVGLALVTEPGGAGVTVALGAALVGVLSWVVLLRPRVTAYADRLVLRNQLSETHLPLAEVDAVVVRHALNVWVGEERYVCAAIGRSSRSMLRQRRPGPAPVLGGVAAPDAAPGAGGDGAAGDYAGFVETRIAELADGARRDARGEAPPPVRTVWAWPEIVAVGVIAAALLVALLVG